MRTKLILGIAVVAIVFGLYGLAGNLTESKAPQLVEKNKPAKLISVWQLNSDVPSAEVVRPNQLKIVKLSEEQAAAIGISEDMLFEYPPGSIFRSDMKVGTTLFATDIVAPNSPEYLDLTLSDGFVPYPLKVSPDAVVGGVIRASSYVDVLALTSPEHLVSVEVNSSDSVARGRAVSISPVLMGVKVLRVEQTFEEGAQEAGVAPDTHLILELDRKQVSILSVAKQISSLEVHKSVGDYAASELHADAGDVLPGFKSVIEYRAETVTIK
ncbi:Flp pilus assembly protein CpaB [Vibrio sinaloensis DSM 21326]|uniref:Flp pilus assembly protein CpaB n=1 Tax=Vibrio sinaloensis DSM 21326 TaxID=945550 RepID=E8M165_PHOS4|nr:Flp pilus assembly protein CpaB [Vibrio sinaloensis]EGA72211.1 Flp pilus assembly protein CpaB [Vibrio sinaloensis DSM 21326]